MWYVKSKPKLISAIFIFYEIERPTKAIHKKDVNQIFTPQPNLIMYWLFIKCHEESCVLHTTYTTTHFLFLAMRTLYFTSSECIAEYFFSDC